MSFKSFLGLLIIGSPIDLSIISSYRYALANLVVEEFYPVS